MDNVEKTHALETGTQEREKDNNKVIVKIGIDTNEIDEVLDKAKKLCKLLNQASEIAESISQKDLFIRINAKSDNGIAELASITTK